MAENLESYLADFIWRRTAADPFSQILSEIKKFFGFFINVSFILTL